MTFRALLNSILLLLLGENVVYFISIDIINIMLLSIRLNLNSPRRVCATLWSGARDFKSNLVKEWPKKENTSEDCVKRVYERSMRHDDIPLLSTWESYASSLPVREFKDSGNLGSSCIKPLYKYPYWSNEKDLADG